MDKTYAQYGCGLSAPEQWMNFDTSPSLRIQKNPFLKLLLGPLINVKFPSNVLIGDIVSGLPLKQNSVDGLYCSHVLEHLSFDDFHRALENSYSILKPGGTFRLVMPDLEFLINAYIDNRKAGKSGAAIDFISDTYMVDKHRNKGIKGIAEQVFGNSKHLWLWDYPSTIQALEKVGFKNVEPCAYGDSGDPMFDAVEDKDRFVGSLALKMTK